MKLTVKIQIPNIVEIIIYLFPLTFQLSNIFGYSIYYGAYIMLALTYFYIQKKIVVEKKIITMATILVLAQLFVPLLSGYFKIQTAFYCAFLVLMLVDCYIFGVVYRDTRDKKRFIRNILISNSIVLIYQVLTNLSSYNFESFMTVFNSSRKGRAFFGFTHPNFAAMFMVIEVIMCYMYARKLRKQHKFIMYVFMSFWIFSICMTGSRTSLYCVFFFLILEFIICFSGMFKKYKYLMYIVFVAIAFFSVWIIFGEALSNNYSDRSSSASTNFSTINNSGRLLFGSGGLPTSQAVEGIEHSDNWYITTIINVGVVGLLLYSIMLLPFFVRVIKKSKLDTSIPTVSILLALLAFSLGENVLFVPGVELSWFCWCLFMATAVTPQFREKSRSI